MGLLPTAGQPSPTAPLRAPCRGLACLQFHSSLFRGQVCGGKAGKKENTTARSCVLLISPRNSKKIKIQNKKIGSFDFMCSKPSLDGSLQQANQSPQKQHHQEWWGHSRPSISSTPQTPFLTAPNSAHFTFSFHIHPGPVLLQVDITLFRELRNAPNSAVLFAGCPQLPAALSLSRSAAHCKVGWLCPH